MGHADRGAESFRDLLLRHRGRIGLTQRELAARLDVNVRTIQEWEAGKKHPGGARLQALITTLLATGGLSPGREAEEARTLWTAVLEAAPRMRVPLDEVWLSALLTGGFASGARPEPGSGSRTGAATSVAGRASGERRQDWGDAPDVVGFVGRSQELTTLRTWTLGECCRLVVVLGGGGIGKTSLVAQLAQDLVTSFQRVYWRSLRDVPPGHEWLGGAISFLSDQRIVPAEGDAARLTVLLQLLRERSTLLVLDNFETVLRPADPEGHYRDGYEAYGRLLRTVGDGRHSSCLALTSREAPPELADLPGGAVRTLELGGLDAAAGRQLLANKQLSGSADEWAKLIARFDGNGLALKVVGERIRDLFAGDLSAFIDMEEPGTGPVFGGFRRLLAEQLERSSRLEQQVLDMLAVAREPVTLRELLARLSPRVSHAGVLEAVGALRRRSLLERAEIAGPAAFTPQSVVLEYLTDRLVQEVSNEITRGRPARLVNQPLIEAQARDYVRQTQERLIGTPILQRLESECTKAETQMRLLELLDAWRDRPLLDQGYGPGNVVNLLRLFRGHLRGVDLSRLALRQVYLQEAEAQDATLAGSHLTETVLADAFGYPTAVALSADATLLAVGTPAGEVRVWRVTDRTPLLSVQSHVGAVWGLALSGDGPVLASGGMDGQVKLWEVPDGQLLASLAGHTGAVHGVAISRDGRVLASGGDDGRVMLWEGARRECAGDADGKWRRGPGRRAVRRWAAGSQRQRGRAGAALGDDGQAASGDAEGAHRRSLGRGAFWRRAAGGEDLSDHLCQSLGAYGARKVFRGRGPEGLAQPVVDVMA
ncbi:MAG: helix-turn-helix domain-containing protein, partial [Chloroflexi bacterium]|nr:helix-turn-helix domain-containing protein [Chloroflexota bacterium]